jgi:hypothetical protein
MTRKEGLSLAVKKYKETKDQNKKLPEPKWYMLKAFWDGRAKIHWDWYRNSSKFI